MRPFDTDGQGEKPKSGHPKSEIPGVTFSRGMTSEPYNIIARKNAGYTVPRVHKLRLTSHSPQIKSVKVWTLFLNDLLSNM